MSKMTEIRLSNGGVVIARAYRYSILYRFEVSALAISTSTYADGSRNV